MPDYVTALLAQIPLVIGFFVALQRGFIYVGRDVERERSEHLREVLYVQNQLAQERADRKEAEDRLDNFKETLNEATDALTKSVEFNERLVAELAKRN